MKKSYEIVQNGCYGLLFMNFHENYVQNRTKWLERPRFHDETAGQSRRSETVLGFSDRGEVHSKNINK